LYSYNNLKKLTCLNVKLTKINSKAYKVNNNKKINLTLTY